MGDDLHRLAQIFPPPLFLDDRAINLAGGDVVVPGEFYIQEPLVVPQIQIHFAPILENEDLPVLEGTHEPGIDVDVRIDLYRRDFIAPVHEQPADGCRGYAFPKAAHNSACDHNISHYSRLQERSRSVYDKGNDQDGRSESPRKLGNAIGDKRQNQDE